jgi:translocation and assembly module TamA
VSTRAFGRGIAQLAGWIPLDIKTQLALRAEAGAVVASTSDGIPAPLLFRTGGDTTVRGYAFQSLGPRVGDATVGGRYYALASAEVVRWIGASWGIAAFVDAGNAADHVHDLKPVYGYGVGGRLRTPIGPFRLDLAYGEATKTVRVHLSVGLSF